MDITYKNSEDKFFKNKQGNDASESIRQGRAKDFQTKLYSREATIQRVEETLDSMKESKGIDNYCFLLIDINNFKKLNELWGYLYGDIILETFAKHLTELFKPDDIVGRVGGDEFVVLFHTNRLKKDIIHSAESIIKLVTENILGIKEKDQMSLSIGISLAPQDGNSYLELFQKAEIALYESKTTGKNHFLIYNPDMEFELTGIKQKKPAKKKMKRNHEEISDSERRLLNYTFDIIGEEDNIETAINQIFTEIGKYYDLSRITILEEENGSQKTKVSYEWLNNGTISYGTIRNTGELAFSCCNIKENGYYYFDDTSKLETTPKLQEFYEQLGIKALAQFAIYDSNQFIGSVNFEDCQKPRNWQKSVIDTLTIITKIISNYILQLRSKEELNNEIFFTQAMLNNQKLSNYAIKADTYELLYVSEYTENLFPNVKLGELCYKAIFGRSKPCSTCPLNGLSKENNRYSVEAYHEKLEAWLSTTASSVDMPDGQKMNLICSSDVTGFIDRVKSKDTLTGLLTLPKFEAEAMKFIAGKKEKHYAILYCDFDKFKYINDEWGYSNGNGILKLFADSVSRELTEKELFCRISGDIFVILLNYKEKEEVPVRVKSIANKLNQEFLEQFPKMNPIIICGIYYMTDNDRILSVAMDKANTARKRYKGFHKSTFTIYDETLHQEVTKEKQIENQMHEALKKHEFLIFMQPKVNLRTLSITGAEALVRWKTGSGDIMSPADFIPIFEKNGFILELDFYVYEETFKTLRRWLDMGKKPIVVSINVSRLHLDDNLFISKLEKLVEKYYLPPNLIEIEITENIFLKGLERLKKLIIALREKGFLISIDDFGSGYSSLNMLKTVPIDILKLDKDFFMDNTMDDKDKIVLTNIINLAKGLGLKVISEGVETLDQARFLRENRCDMVQGYFFYKPMPLKDLEEILD